MFPLRPYTLEKRIELKHGGKISGFDQPLGTSFSDSVCPPDNTCNPMTPSDFPTPTPPPPTTFQKRGCQMHEMTPNLSWGVYGTHLPIYILIFTFVRILFHHILTSIVYQTGLMHPLPLGCICETVMVSLGVVVTNACNSRTLDITRTQHACMKSALSSVAVGRAMC